MVARSDGTPPGGDVSISVGKLVDLLERARAEDYIGRSILALLGSSGAGKTVLSCLLHNKEMRVEEVEEKDPDFDCLTVKVPRLSLVQEDPNFEIGKGGKSCTQGANCVEIEDHALSTLDPGGIGDSQGAAREVVNCHHLHTAVRYAKEVRFALVLSYKQVTAGVYEYILDLVTALDGFFDRKDWIDHCAIFLTHTSELESDGFGAKLSRQQIINGLYTKMSGLSSEAKDLKGRGENSAAEARKRAASVLSKITASLNTHCQPDVFILDPLSDDRREYLEALQDIQPYPFGDSCRVHLITKCHMQLKEVIDDYAQQFAIDLRSENFAAVQLSLANLATLASLVPVYFARQAKVCLSQLSDCIASKVELALSVFERMLKSQAACEEDCGIVEDCRRLLRSSQQVRTEFGMDEDASEISSELELDGQLEMLLNRFVSEDKILSADWSQAPLGSWDAADQMCVFLGTLNRGLHVDAIRARHRFFLSKLSAFLADRCLNFEQCVFTDRLEEILIAWQRAKAWTDVKQVAGLTDFDSCSVTFEEYLTGVREEYATLARQIETRLLQAGVAAQNIEAEWRQVFTVANQSTLRLLIGEEFVSASLQNLVDALTAAALRALDELDARCEQSQVTSMEADITSIQALAELDSTVAEIVLVPLSRVVKSLQVQVDGYVEKLGVALKSSNIEKALNAAQKLAGFTFMMDLPGSSFSMSLRKMRQKVLTRYSRLAQDCRRHLKTGEYDKFDECRDEMVRLQQLRAVALEGFNDLFTDGELSSIELDIGGRANSFVSSATSICDQDSCRPDALSTLVRESHHLQRLTKGMPCHDNVVEAHLHLRQYSTKVARDLGSAIDVDMCFSEVPQCIRRARNFEEYPVLRELVDEDDLPVQRVQSMVAYKHSLAMDNFRLSLERKDLEAANTHLKHLQAALQHLSKPGMQEDLLKATRDWNTAAGGLAGDSSVALEGRDWRTVVHAVKQMTKGSSEWLEAESRAIECLNELARTTMTRVELWQLVTADDLFDDSELESLSSLMRLLRDGISFLSRVFDVSKGQRWLDRIAQTLANKIDTELIQQSRRKLRQFHFSGARSLRQAASAMISQFSGSEDCPMYKLDEAVQALRVDECSSQKNAEETLKNQLADLDASSFRQSMEGLRLSKQPQMGIDLLCTFVSEKIKAADTVAKSGQAGAAATDLKAVESFVTSIGSHGSEVCLPPLREALDRMESMEETAVGRLRALCDQGKFTQLNADLHRFETERPSTRASFLRCLSGYISDLGKDIESARASRKCVQMIIFARDLLLQLHDHVTEAQADALTAVLVERLKACVVALAYQQKSGATNFSSADAGDELSVLCALAVSLTVLGQHSAPERADAMALLLELSVRVSELNLHVRQGVADLAPVAIQDAIAVSERLQPAVDAVIEADAMVILGMQDAWKILQAFPTVASIAKDVLARLQAIVSSAVTQIKEDTFDQLSGQVQLLLRAAPLQQRFPKIAQLVNSLKGMVMERKNDLIAQCTAAWNQGELETLSSMLDKLDAGEHAFVLMGIPSPGQEARQPALEYAGDLMSIPERTANSVADAITSLEHISTRVKPLAQAFGVIISRMIDDFAHGRNNAVADLGQALKSTSLGQKVVVRQPQFKQLELMKFLRTVAHTDDYCLQGFTALTFKKASLKERVVGFVMGDAVPAEFSDKHKRNLAELLQCFRRKFDACISKYENGNIQALAQEVMAIAVEGFEKGQTQDEIIMATLARVAALWSLYEARTGSGRSSQGLLMKPHTIQLLVMFRLLGLDCDGLVSHLALQHTGEGKSVTLGMLSIIFALLGYTVDCVCYSRLLSDRDFAAFKPLFDMLGVSSSIQYGQVGEVFEARTCELVGGDLRGPCNELLKGCLKKPYCKNASRKAAGRVLLIDEIDTLVDKFIGHQYVPTALISTPAAFSVIQYIWTTRHDGVSAGKIFELPEFKELIELYPSMESAIKGQVYLMLQDVLTFSELQYEVRDGEIGVAENMTINANVALDHKRTFAYFHEVEQGNIASKALIEERVGFFAICSKFSYAAFSSLYEHVLGVSGTVQTETLSEKALLKLLGVAKITFSPSIFNRERLEFKEEGHTIITENLESYFMAIEDELFRAVQNKRAGLVFFETIDMLNAFHAWASQRQNLVDIAVLHEGSLHVESLIAEAVMAGKVTLCSSAHTRGTDFMSFDKDVKDHGGLLVICTFFCRSKEQETQTKGRTARRGDKGSFRLILLRSDVLSLAGVSEEDLSGAIAANTVYKYLSEKRKLAHEAELQQKLSDVEKCAEEHALGLNFMRNLATFSPQKVDALLAHVVRLTGELAGGQHEPCFLVVCLDESGSMRDRPKHGNFPWTGAVEAVTSLVNGRIEAIGMALARDDLFAVVSYGARARTMVPVQPLTQPFTLTPEFQGDTKFDCGIRAVLELLKERRDALAGYQLSFVFLSDGGSSTGDAEMVELVAEFPHLRVNVLGFGNDYDEKRLARLAGLGKGHFHAAVSNVELAEKFRAVGLGLSAPMRL